MSKRPSWSKASPELTRTVVEQALASQYGKEEANLFTKSVLNNPWIQSTPTPKQTEFLIQSKVRESLYGGAAGGGKTISLLMGALQFVDFPGYAALLLRKTFAELSLPGALLSVADEWLRPTKAKWVEREKQWTFPSGATLTFGYLEKEGDKYRYDSSEFHYIGCDELTQLYDSDYTYLFSRNRKKKGDPIPLRMRSATNPGGRGHAWVKKRFRTQQDLGKVWFPPVDPGKEAMSRLFIPAKLGDNPHLDERSYRQGLQSLRSEERKQKEEGDWTDFNGEHMAPYGWPRYQVWQHAYSWGGRPILMSDVWRFAILDPATDVKKDDDYTGIAVFGVGPRKELLILDALRVKRDVGDILPLLARVCRYWRPAFVGIEDVAFQKLLLRDAQWHEDIPAARPVKPQGKGKLARGITAVVMGEEGRIYLPENEAVPNCLGEPWLEWFCDELLSFTGDEDPHDEAWDLLAYAALLVSRYGGSGNEQGPCALTQPRDDVFLPAGVMMPRLLPNGRTQGALGDYRPDQGGFFV